MIFFFLHQRLVKVVAALLHSGDASNATATYIEYVGCAHRPNKLAKLKFDRHLRVSILTHTIIHPKFHSLFVRWYIIAVNKMLKLFRCHHMRMVCKKGKNEKNVGNSIDETWTHTYLCTNVWPKRHYHRSFFSKFVSFACSIAWVMTFHLFRLNCVSLPLSKSECAIKIARTV